MKRGRLLLYCFAFGGLGWLWLLVLPAPVIVPAVFFSFVLLALAVDVFSFRIPPAGSYGMAGVVFFTAALLFGPAIGALVAAVEGVISGLLLPFLHRSPRNFYVFVGRPALRSGTRALGVLSGGALYGMLSGEPQWATGTQSALLLLGCLLFAYVLVVQLGRVGREYFQGGVSGVSTWWRSTWRLVLGAEFAPLPLAILGAAIYTGLGTSYFLLASISFIVISAVVRRATSNLQRQRRSVRELALLNEVSRAIIRSELKVDALCELIYREASRIVDTSSFHLGLFDGNAYTLVVQVQDRVRLQPLTITLEPGDGIIGWMRQTGRALLVEDFQEEMSRLPARPRYRSAVPPRSGIYVPLIAGDAVIGSISVQSYQIRAFDASDLRLLSLIADQAAIAITRARVFAEARQRAVQLQAIHEVSERITAILNLEELLLAVVRLIREHFLYHPVHIFTIDPGSEVVTFRASTANEAQRAHIRATLLPGQGVVGRAAVEGRSILVDDLQSDPRYAPTHRATRSELAVPLQVGDQILGVLDVQSDEAHDFNDEDLFVMQTLADQIAVAIDSVNMYTAQQEEAWTLNALLQVAENIGRATTLSDLLATVVRLPPLLIGANRCFCLLWHREARNFTLNAAYGLAANQRRELVEHTFAIDDTPLLAQIHTNSQDVATRAQLVYVGDAQAHAAELAPLIELCQSGTVIVLPLIARTSLLGALVLDYNLPAQRPTQRQVTLYTGAMAQIAGALESVMLAREADEAQQLEQELKVAREIQTTLLPAASPQPKGWQIDATWRSARLVGGDFFDFWWLEQEQQARQANSNQADVRGEPQQDVIGFVIADVSDKGVPAAMFMALSRSLVRAAALDGSPPALAMERANRWITRDSESGMFVTLFYGLLDTATGLLRYTCAGHNPPLVYHVATEQFEALHTPGIALGVLEEIQLHEAFVSLEQNDVLVCYTDGITETINDEVEAFGVERLQAVIVRCHAQGAVAIAQAIMDEVMLFASGQPPFDDITMVVIKREQGVDTTNAQTLHNGSAG